MCDSRTEDFFYQLINRDNFSWSVELIAFYVDCFQSYAAMRSFPSVLYIGSHRFRKILRYMMNTRFSA